MAGAGITELHMAQGCFLMELSGPAGQQWQVWTAPPRRTGAVCSRVVWVWTGGGRVGGGGQELGRVTSGAVGGGQAVWSCYPSDKARRGLDFLLSSVVYDSEGG